LENVKKVNIYAAKTHLSRLIDAALRGEDVVIARDNEPVVRLVPIRAAGAKTRRLGSAKGKVRIADDFDAPLPDMDDYQRDS
jgi:prevent-host-death family protein